MIGAVSGTWSREDEPNHYGDKMAPGGDGHYRQGGVQPADFIASNHLPGWKALAIKYIFRAGHKYTEDQDPLEATKEDIAKAIWWLEKGIEYEGR